MGWSPPRTRGHPRWDADRLWRRRVLGWSPRLGRRRCLGLPAAPPAWRRALRLDVRWRACCAPENRVPAARTPRGAAGSLREKPLRDEPDLHVATTPQRRVLLRLARPPDRRGQHRLRGPLSDLAGRGEPPAAADRPAVAQLAHLRQIRAH